MAVLERFIIGVSKGGGLRAHAVLLGSACSGVKIVQRSHQFFYCDLELFFFLIISEGVFVLIIIIGGADLVGFMRRHLLFVCLLEAVEQVGHVCSKTSRSRR